MRTAIDSEPLDALCNLLVPTFVINCRYITTEPQNSELVSLIKRTLTRSGSQQIYRLSALQVLIDFTRAYAHTH
jgi:hypothetical protein